MSRPRSVQRGNAVLETALFIPILLLLISGMVQFGKITYVYYTLKKTLYTAARYLAIQQGVDFCDDANTAIAAAKQYALTGTTDGSAQSFLPALTADMIQVQTECYDPASQSVGQCLAAGCGSAAGGPRPDYVVVSIPDGYQVTPRIPFVLLDPIPLRPQVRVPFGGT
jgi:hypothetical protein